MSNGVERDVSLAPGGQAAGARARPPTQRSWRGKVLALALGGSCALCILAVGVAILSRWRDPAAGVTMEGVVRTSEGDTLGRFSTSPSSGSKAIEELREEPPSATKPPTQEPPRQNADRDGGSGPPRVTTRQQGPDTRRGAPRSEGLGRALATVWSGLRRPVAGRPRRVRERRFYQRDWALGHKPRPNTQVALVKRKDGRVVFEATYTVDRFSRRVTPTPRGHPSPNKALLLFGGSYTFGEGVNDDQTVAACVGAQTDEWQVYNYGLCGGAPQHMLEQVRSSRIADEVPQRKALAVYTFLHVHISRAVGTERVLRGMGSSYPWYEWDEARQKLVRRGFFGYRRGPRRPPLGDKLLESVRDYYGERLTKADAWLTARLIVEAGRIFERKFDTEGFYVLVYPLRQGPLTDYLIDLLKRDGVRILDYRSLLTTRINYEEYFIPNDGHPRPKTHRLIADQLVKDLRISTRHGGTGS